MANERIAERIEFLELRVNRLEQIPERMDRLEGQILDLRSKIREQFSQAMAHADKRIDDAIAHSDRHFDETMSAMRALHEQAMAHNRLLHEDAIDRIGRMREGEPTKNTLPKRRAKKR